MWNPFRANDDCPVDADMRQWVDGRFQWLSDQLGEDTFRNRRVILPTPEFFPDPFDNDSDGAEALLARVAEYMDIPPARVKLVLYDERPPPSASLSPLSQASTAGLYFGESIVDETGNSRVAIGIEYAQLANAMSLVATLAHEVGHEILLGQRRVSYEQPDHEPLTDLLTVFMGMGIFTANATIQDRGWSSGMWAGWQTKKHGYLDQRTFGYALARFAWMRGESNPAWIKHVRPDVRVTIKQGLRFLKSEAGR